MCDFFKFNNKKMTLSPKESAEFVVKNAEHVQVHEDGIKNIVKEVKTNHISKSKINE